MEHTDTHATTMAAATTDLVVRWRGLVRGIAMRVLHNEADAEDAAQDAFVRVHQALGTLRDPRALPSFIARIAERAALDKLRSRARAQRFSGVDADLVASGDGADPCTLAMAGETRARVARALASLPEPQRVVVEMRGAGLTSPAIARALGIAVGTVESRLFRARQRMVAESG